MPARDAFDGVYGAETVREAQGTQREHNSKSMKAKGDEPHDSPRERPEHWQQTQVGRTPVPRGHCPPTASADRVLSPLCGELNKQD
jgi:hypothetical protein